MWCTKCNHDLSECTCDDIDERFESLKNDDNFIFKMCRKCGLHYNRCKCDEPDWTTSHDGVELEDVQGKTLDKMFDKDLQKRFEKIQENFEKMKDDYEERKVDRFEEEDLVVDTTAINDSAYPYETGIRHPFYNEGKWIIVQTYNSKKEAIIGHKEWVIKMTANALPHELTDVAKNFASALCDIFDDDDWRTKKGGV